MSTVELPTYKPKDFATDQDVRWCPGCGDYAALKSVQMTLSKTGTRREDFVFISGIGCAARFPYYVNTYGMHSIHGRALAFATGAKIANPKLDLWVVSGDGSYDARWSPSGDALLFRRGWGRLMQVSVEGEDEWGCVWQKLQRDNTHGQCVGHPINDYARLGDHPFPDYRNPARYKAAAEAVAR